MLRAASFFISGILCFSAPSFGSGLYDPEKSCAINTDLQEEMLITKLDAIFRSNLMGRNLDDPMGDAHKRIEIGDYRFLSVSYYALEFPGIELERDYERICYLGFNSILGSTDGAVDSDHAELIGKFSDYAKTYNEYILSKADKLIEEFNRQKEVGR